MATENIRERAALGLDAMEEVRDMLIMIDQLVETCDGRARHSGWPRGGWPNMDYWRRGPLE